MVTHGCKADGSLNESKFDEPMPWIGIYVAAAAFTCGIAMAIDALHGFRYKKIWFPCRFFSLNATTLTLIAIAIKFSMDLNATMPHRQDQLAKVSSSAFICTVMGNLLPSLGTMENTELLINIVALVILVVTAIANICIQMGTGVIFAFGIEHGFIMVLMLILLVISCSLSLAIPTTKYYLDIKYIQKLKSTNIECSRKKILSMTEGLREDLRKYWLLAYSSGPQFVIGRSAPCTASGAFCLLNTLILTEAILRSYLMPSSIKFCKGESDYKWSTTLVLISQTIAVGIGTIAPAVRWFMAINFNCSKKAKHVRSNVLIVEKYWIKKLILWQLQPLDFKFYDELHYVRKLAHRAKHQMFGLFIGLQKGIVLSCQVIRFISILFVGRLLAMSMSMTMRGEEDTNLSRFIVHLDGEEELVELMMKNNGDATAHWIKIGEKQKPKNLIQLLKQVDSLLPFTGVREFDNDKVPSLGYTEPPNCWALPIVTLTSIALALPSVNQELIKQLVRSVHEGLKYVREMEDNLDEKKDLKNVRIAEEVVWTGVELDGIWLDDVDLREMAVEGKGVRETIKSLSDISKGKFMEYGKTHLLHSNEWYLEEDPSRWCIRMLAANSMYRICETFLLAPDDVVPQYESSPDQRLFEKLTLIICTLFSACFTNLQHVIYEKCRESRIEEREQNIRYAVLLFGKTQEILRILDMKKIQDSSPGQLVHIDDWHLLSKSRCQISSISSSTDKESGVICSPTSNSSLCISIAQ